MSFQHEMHEAVVKQIQVLVGDVLAEFQVFQGLSPAVQKILPTITRYATKKGGVMLFRQGQKPDVCYILLSGEVIVWKESEFGHHGSTRFEVPSSTVLGSAEARQKCAFILSRIKQESFKFGRNLVQKPKRSFKSVRNSHKSKKPMTSMLSGDSRPGTKRFVNSMSPVAVLGSGVMVGEVALLNDQPRNASVSTRNPCEFLVIERNDFDRVLKEEMRRAREERHSFLMQHIPGMSRLSESMSHDCSYYFRHHVFPIHHQICSHGESSDGAIHLVFKGTAEVLQGNRQAQRPISLGTSKLFRRERTCSRPRRVGTLAPGGIIAPHVGADKLEPFDIVATSSPLEVLTVTKEELRRLPDVVQRGIREVTDQAAIRRQAACVTLPPVAMSATLRYSSSLPTLGSTGLSSSCRSRTRSLHPLEDFQQFLLEPGECLGLSGQRPAVRLKPLYGATPVRAKTGFD
jgi:CRP-like cAMP-binding protein